MMILTHLASTFEKKIEKNGRTCSRSAIDDRMKRSRPVGQKDEAEEDYEARLEKIRKVCYGHIKIKLITSNM